MKLHLLITNMKRIKIIPFFSSILIAQAAGIIGSIFTVSSINSWYNTIAKPSWNPPSWIFGPVWISLYTLMGIAAYLIWCSKKSTQRNNALGIYGIQLLLNSTWSILFFGIKRPDLAFVEVLVLLTMIILTIIKFDKISRTASVLLAPYLAWVSLATILNYNIWQLNS